MLFMHAGVPKQFRCYLKINEQNEHYLERKVYCVLMLIIT